MSNKPHSKTGKWDLYLKKLLKELLPEYGFSSSGKKVMCNIICYLCHMHLKK